MNLLFAVHHFPPNYTGGAEWRTYRTAAALQARGHQVRVLCIERTDAGSPQKLAWQDDTFEGIAVRRLFFNLSAAPDPFLWSYDNRWIGDHLHAYLAEIQPDVMHLFSGYLMSGRALLTAKEQGVPVVVTLTDFWFLCPRINLLRSNGQISTLPINPVSCARCLGEEKRRYRIPGQMFPGLMNVYWKTQKAEIAKIERRLTFLRDALNQADAIISPSQFLKAVYTQWGIDAGRILFSRQGRDFPALKADTLAKTPSSVLRIGYMGQIAPHKGVHLLFEAARQMPQAPIHIQVFGDTSAFPDYTQHLKQLTEGDSRLELCGVYQCGSISELYPHLDVLVVPSIWYENSPNVILEAFAHKTPVVTSNLGGMA
ncbi:MAG: glycosyltransferase family 4 protein, partial [Chloroflexi bacterium]|nr:glycosyltransferase family 4 protein [Chloroflexota bacterium]